jgi:phosphohistidine phosphatase
VNLYVMRHGAALDSSPTGKDRDRPLAPKGRGDAGRAAERLVEAQGSLLPRVASSPYLRARETAEIVATTAAEPGIEIEFFTELEPEEELPLELVRSLAGAGKDALVVGHHPMVISLLRMLVTDVRPLPLGLHPGMLVGLRRLAREDVIGGFAVTLVWKP